MKNLGRIKVPEKAIGNGIQNRSGSWPLKGEKLLYPLNLKKISFFRIICHFSIVYKKLTAEHWGR